MNLLSPKIKNALKADDFYRKPRSPLEYKVFLANQFTKANVKFSKLTYLKYKVNIIITQDLIRDFKLPEKVIESIIENERKEFKYRDYLLLISSKQELSESLIRKYKDVLQWHSISCHQKLSEEFILEHKSYVDWHHIAFMQELSEQFVLDNIDKLTYRFLSFSKYLDKYSKELQRLILANTIQFNDSDDLKCYTNYMRDELEKHKMFI
jgi:hypothetical protein